MRGEVTDVPTACSSKLSARFSFLDQYRIHRYNTCSMQTFWPILQPDKFKLFLMKAEGLAETS